MSRDYIYKTPDKYELQITTFGNQFVSEKPAVIFVHGFKGFKDWGFVPYLAEFFASKEFFVITFNFSHNGIGENKLEFTELDKFEKNTFSRELEELETIINAYNEGFFGKPFGDIYLIGHSRGGGISILKAAENVKIKKLVSWAAVSTFDRYTERQKEVWKKEGKFQILNTRTQQIMNLGIELLEDLENNKEDKLNILKATSEIRCKWLICHGEEDLAVNVKEAKELYEKSNKDNTELFILPSTGHTFDIVHPFNGTSKHFEKLLNKTFEFLSM